MLLGLSGGLRGGCEYHILKINKNNLTNLTTDISNYIMPLKLRNNPEITQELFSWGVGGLRREAFSSGMGGEILQQQQPFFHPAR